MMRAVLFLWVAVWRVCLPLSFLAALVASSRDVISEWLIEYARLLWDEA